MRYPRHEARGRLQHLLHALRKLLRSARGRMFVTNDTRCNEIRSWQRIFGPPACRSLDCRARTPLRGSTSTQPVLKEHSDEDRTLEAVAGQTLPEQPAHQRRRRGPCGRVNQRVRFSPVNRGYFDGGIIAGHTR